LVVFVYVIPERRYKSIKRPLIIISMLIAGVIAGMLIANALYVFTGFSVFNNQKNDVPAEDTAHADMTMLAFDILEYIKDDDFVALSRIVHPEYGVILSPYATINLSTDRWFNADQIALFGTDTSVYVWGVYNGSGEPIVLTTSEYFSQFVPAALHMKSPILGINQIVRSGNALENMIDIFPDIQFVDFHIPGGEQIEELEWSSLRLGFEEYEGHLRLMAIVYSKWTV